MGIFSKLKEPVFLKESSDADVQLDKLRALEPLLNSEGQAKIKQDIKNLEYGIIGEKNIAFELKNSHMPMYILHDIYLEDGDLSAQIDYLVLTKKLCFVVECKNLYGDIEINNAGDFVRTVEFGGRKKKEGIYSPITQNQRHLELIKKIKIDKRSNIITKLMTDKYFDDFHKSVIVLANPKTVLNAKYAKKEVKEKVIRADQLVKYIKALCEQSKELEDSDDKLLSRAQAFLGLHKVVEKDFTEKYEQYKIVADSVNKPSVAPVVERIKPVVAETVVKETAAKETTVEESDIFKELRAYRLERSREEKIKPYYIYNDNQLKDLIFKMPRTKEALQSVGWFGPAKIVKYGDAILQIIQKY